MLAGDESELADKRAIRTVYDPCCGSGGMLMIAKEHITVGLRKNGELLRPPINKDAEIHLFGQEVNPETWAVSKSDLFMKDPTGRDADNITFGSTLSTDRHAGQSFDYLIANPPYGKDWKRDEDAVRAENARGTAGRFAAGLPRISDGQLLFLLHMLAHTKEPKDGGSRLAIIMNGSPLFTRRRRQRRERNSPLRPGERSARSADRPARAALLQHWHRHLHLGGHQPQGARVARAKSSSSTPRPSGCRCARAWATSDARSRSNARRRSGKLLAGFKDGETSKIFPTTHFGFRKITVERPLRLNFQACPERIARLEDEKGFQALAQSKKKGAAGAKEQAEGRALQEAIRKLVRALPDAPIKDRDKFERALDAAEKQAGLSLPTPARKAILSALSERDESAEICRDKDGSPEPDSELRDTESVPLSEKVEAFFEREVKPHVPDAWIDESKRDPKDGQVGLVGYEINFNRYFYRYTPPRPLEEIEAEIRGLETEIMQMLGEVTGSR